MLLNPLRVMVRCMAFLGFASLTFTGEIAPAYLAVGWAAWIGSFQVDRYADWQQKLRKIESAVALVLLMVMAIDFFVFRNVIFQAITHFLILFQVFKLVGLKERRDCLQILVFSFFQILASCTLSADAWHAVILLAFIPTAAMALFWHQMEHDAEQYRSAPAESAHPACRRMARWIAAGALPLNLLLTAGVFILFPRLTLNASIPGFQGSKIGYTEQMNLSRTGDLEGNRRPVLWMALPNSNEQVRWDGYLRGTTLDQFDGRQWTPASADRPRLLYPDRNSVFTTGIASSRGQSLRQQMMLLDSSASTLFAAGTPVRVVAPLSSLQQDRAGTLKWSSNRRRPLQYEVYSTLDPLLDSAAPNDSRYLQLPSLDLSKVSELAKRAGGTGSPAQIAERLESHLRSSYGYSTELGGSVSSNPVETFLFNRRKGPCGHFASAMAVMLRLRGIPSRVAVGYLRGEWNQLAQQYVIRENDAHAWVEAYLPKQGWVRFDPTPRATAVSGATRVIHRARQYWDYLELTWDKLIIDYDLYAQLRMFERAKSSSDEWSTGLSRWWAQRQASRRSSMAKDSPNSGGETSGWPLRSAAFAMLVMLIGFLWKSYGAHERTPASIRFYTAFLRQMARKGVPKASSETAREYAARLIHRWPQQAGFIEAMTDRYYKTRFTTR